MDSEILDLADYSPVGRFLVGTFNTSTTISAAYAAAIVLSSTLAFAALYALLYFGLATQSFSNYNNYNRRSAGGGSWFFGHNSRKKRQSNHEDDQVLSKLFLMLENSQENDELRQGQIRCKIIHYACNFLSSSTNNERKDRVKHLIDRNEHRMTSTDLESKEKTVRFNAQFKESLAKASRTTDDGDCRRLLLAEECGDTNEISVPR